MVTLSELVADKQLNPESGNLGNPGVRLAKEEPELVFINKGFPPLSAKTVLKIDKGHYVDFKELLPKMPSWDDNELEDNGIIVVSQSRHVKNHRKPIQDVATWIEAFLTFAAVRNWKHPEQTNDLLAYGTLIVCGARDYKGSGWLSYDFQHHKLAAARGNSHGWSQRDVALWNDTVCKEDLPRPVISGGGGVGDDNRSATRKA